MQKTFFLLIAALLLCSASLPVAFGARPATIKPGAQAAQQAENQATARDDGKYNRRQHNAAVQRNNAENGGNHAPAQSPKTRYGEILIHQE